MEPLLLTLTLVLNQNVTAEVCREVLYKTYPAELIQELANHKTTFNCKLNVMGRIQEISQENDSKLIRDNMRGKGWKTVYEKCGNGWCEVDNSSPMLDNKD
tara:strand:- start:186 stop:488 length:303 start_codon:yes stop_codon:yes gene_type:complete